MSQKDLNNQGRQTELVKRGIINWIADHGLKEGDRIPTQTELRTNLQVGNAVIGRAIQALVEEGVLTSLGGRRGFVVRDPVVDGYAGRTFGIICHQDTEFAIMTSLMQTLGMALTRRACHLQFFIKNDAELGDVFALSDFRGAERAVEHRQLDGLFSTVLLTDEAVAFCLAHATPLCYVSVCNANGAGVANGENIADALEYARQRGYRRPMLISMGHPTTRRVREQFLESTRDFDFQPYSAKAFCRFIREDGSAPRDMASSLKTVQLLVHQLLTMPAENRPDVLIVPDDGIANCLALELADSGWHPELVHMEIRQLMFSRPLRRLGAYWEIDTELLAERAVELMLGILNGTQAPDTFIRVPVPLNEREI